jgi:AcrR family transcriptional regulator
MAPRGRPRCFDRTVALQKAMEVFWEHGYEGASMAELTAAMGIASPSLYAAFGCKEQLFREAVEHYTATDGSGTWKALNDSESAREAIEELLKATAEAVTLPGRPAGCFIVLGATNCSPENEDVQKELSERRLSMCELIRLRLERGVAEGELPAGTDVRSLTSYVVSVQQGMSILARDDSSREQLLAVARHAMLAWDGLKARASESAT